MDLKFSIFSGRNRNFQAECFLRVPSSPICNITSKFDHVVCHFGEFSLHFFELNPLAQPVLCSEVPEKIYSADMYSKGFCVASESSFVMVYSRDIF